MVIQDKKRLAIAAVSTVFLAGSALVLGVAAAAASGKAATDSQTKIVPGVYVAGMNLGGLGRDEAVEKVRTWARERTTQTPITLVAPQSGRRWNIPLSEAGGRYVVDAAVDQALQVGQAETWFQRIWRGSSERGVRIEPEFRWNDKAIDPHLNAIAKKIYVAPQNAHARMDASGGLVLTSPERKGVHLNVEATREALVKGGAADVKDGAQADLVIEEEKPRVTAADLGKVGTLLASFSTSYGSSSAPRRHNIEKAAGFINGTLLAPGEVFSYNDIVGPRTPRLGWRNAPTYQDGQVVPGPGGGICQVSTTLYNAALRANLKIVERQGHSMPVRYVPAGCDATVNYGSIDFRFANSTSGPLYVAARTSGGVLAFNLYGIAEAKPGSVDVVSSGRRATARGFAVSTYRVVHNADGTTTRESLGTSSYRPAPAGH